MDLRPFGLTTRQIDRAAKVLGYQPFMISDEIQTGVAYSWLYSDDPRSSPPLVFHRAEWGSEWDKISEANGRLRAMYDDFIAEIAERYPGGSLLDVACNNGYFPVRAQTMGMGRATGADLDWHYWLSIRLLNDVAGTAVHFRRAVYRPGSQRGLLRTRHDVVVASAILCHLPDPLTFLDYLGRLAGEAIFFYGQMIDANELLISLQPPYTNPSWSRPFPYEFNDNTRISRGLFEHSMKSLGFHEIVELPWRDAWLSPYIRDEAPPPAGRDLTWEVRHGSRHVAMLAMR